MHRKLWAGFAGAEPVRVTFVDVRPWLALRLTVVQFIRRRIVIGRSIMRQGVLLTVMGSIRTDRGDVQGEMAEERRVVQGIVRSFGEA